MIELYNLPNRVCFPKQRFGNGLANENGIRVGKPRGRPGDQFQRKNIGESLSHITARRNKPVIVVAHQVTASFGSKRDMPEYISIILSKLIRQRYGKMIAPG